VNELRRKGFTWKAAGFLFMLNTQWLHIFWITDEVVVQYFAGPVAPQWNALLAWVAILIDFLELPVIYDTLRRVWRERDKIVSRFRSRMGGDGTEQMPVTPKQVSRTETRQDDTRLAAFSEVTTLTV
jgi:hypothetical protein